MKTKHTAGPWDFTIDPRHTGIITFGNSDIIIGELYGNDISQEDTLANAKLIAAAPELLAAIKRAEHFMQSQPIFNAGQHHEGFMRAITDIKIAIQKATT